MIVSSSVVLGTIHDLKIGTRRFTVIVAIESRVWRIELQESSEVDLDVIRAIGRWVVEHYGLSDWRQVD